MATQEQRIRALERDMVIVKTDVAKLKSDVESIRLAQVSQGKSITEIAGAQARLASDQAALAAEVAKLADRVSALEAGGGTDPEPEPEPEPPLEITVTGEGLSRTLEATDHGPDAAYAWKLGVDTDGSGEDTAEGRVVEVTYPHAGERTVSVVCTHEDGETMSAEATFMVEESGGGEPEPEPPPDGGGGGETTGQGDLYSLNASALADNAALKNALNTLYEGDAVIGSNLNLVSENGLKRARHTFDRRGLACVNDVSCQCGSKRHAPQQEIYYRIRYATSPNWLAYDEVKCPAQGDQIGDMKLLFIDTVGGYSGRSGGLLSHNGAQLGAPLGSLYVEESMPPKPPGTQTKYGWPGFTSLAGRVYEFQGHWKYSTTPTSNDGFYHLWVVDVATGQRKKLWEDIGFSTRGDTVDLSEKTDGISWCHNQSSGRHDQPMFIDIFEVDIWSAKNPPSWASLT